MGKGISISKGDQIRLCHRQTIRIKVATKTKEIIKIRGDENEGMRIKEILKILYL
jgi:hypothetical protein